MKDLLQKLDELVGYKQKPEFQAAKNILGPEISQDRVYSRVSERKSKMKEFANFLSEKGFVSLGNGAFGITFKHPNLDYVIKVFKTDKPYLEYVRFCEAHKNNPHFPKFRGKIIHVDNDVYAVRMETLEPLHGFAKRAMESIGYYAASNGEYPFAQYLKELDSADRLDVTSLISKQPHLIPAIDMLVDFVKNASFTVGMDMHTGNSMMRGNTVVITDPFYDMDAM